MEEEWQVVIFIVNGYPNHCGLNIPGLGLADLSLLGSRIVPWKAPSLPKGERVFFNIKLTNPELAINFLKKPNLLTKHILTEEKKFRGWHLSDIAPDFVRTLRNQRSFDISDMNCVEWIVRALELGGVSSLDDQIMTPNELHNWCKNQGLKEVENFEQNEF